MVSECENSDNSQNTPPKKKSKCSVKYKYNQKYNLKWELDNEFRGWIKPHPEDIYAAFCSACNVKISTKAGKLQLQRHATSEKHINACASLKKQQTLPNLLAANPRTKFDIEVRDGEIRMAAFLVEHNLPFTVMDHLPRLMQAVCSDSKIAKHLACARTKTTQIVKNVLGKESFEILIDEIKKKRFSLIVDESTDRSCIKHLCMVVRFAANDHHTVRDCFLALVPVQDATANALFKHITSVFNEAGVPYKQNMIGFAADGANTMMGRSHSLRTLLEAEIPNLFVMKCICHSFHLCASYACSKLPRSVEDLARNVYNYFSNSPKRRDHLKQFQQFVDVEPHKLLHPAQTRWLSLKQVVDRLLEQYDALKLFFIDAVAHDRVLAAESILNSLNDPINKLFLEFLAYVLPIFTNLNMLLQSEEPQIHKLHRNISLALKTILDCYLKPEYLQCTPLHRVNHKDPSHFLPIENIYCGAKAEITLGSANLPANAVNFFRLRCLDFYIESVTQINNRVPMDDPIIKGFEILDPSKIQSVRSITHVATRFSNIISADDVQSLDSQWRMLRNADLNFAEKSLTTFWRNVSLAETGDSSPMFPLVTKLVFSLLSLPHSSANVERVFSLINHIKTDQRNSLSTKTIAGCSHTKRLLRDCNCYDFPIIDSLRNKCNNKMYDV